MTTLPGIASGQQADRLANSRPDSTYIREKADRDGDGRISRDEVGYLHGTGDGRGAWRILYNHFDELDGDHDGALSADEIVHAFARQHLEAERLNRAQGLRNGGAQ